MRCPTYVVMAGRLSVQATPALPSDIGDMSIQEANDMCVYARLVDTF
jgi:hypothetical protein